ncbi:MAG: hypothetical protein EOO09_00310 [Chitinophagaceae bacterium]|nr:MAG: hypothetical protein EOO09_00310 [Chitinophagaceae bacterium]
MNEFNELQQLWNKQPLTAGTGNAEELIRKTNSNLKQLKRRYISTAVILLVTVLVLAVYSIWVGVYGWNLFSGGLALMIALLSWRVFLELISIRRSSRIKPAADVAGFAAELGRYYTFRRRILLLHTPLVYLGYMAGFVMLLPGLKGNTSHGFFLYIVISGGLFLAGFIFLLARIIRKEIRTLDELKQRTGSLAGM